MKLYLSSYKIGNEPQKLKALFPKTLENKKPKVAFIFNALDFPDADVNRRSKAIKEDIEELKTIDLEVSELDLKKFFGKEEKLRKVLDNFDGVYISGGNTFILMQAMILSGFDNIFKDYFLNNKEFVYSGYSAAGCVLQKTLRSTAIVDNDKLFPYEDFKKQVYEGMGIVDFVYLPHFQSNHEESDDTDIELQYCKDHNLKYKTLKDGQFMLDEDIFDDKESIMIELKEEIEKGLIRELKERIK